MCRGSIGIVCLLVILTNFVGAPSDTRRLNIPIESILAAIVFFAGEVSRLTLGNVNPLTALIGGTCGFLIGLSFSKRIKID